METHDTPRRVTLRFAPRNQPSGIALGSYHFSLELVRCSGLERFFNRMTQALPTFRSVELGMLTVTEGWQIRIAAGDSIKSFRPYDGVGLGIPLPTTHSRQALRFCEFALFLTQRFFRSFTFRHIDSYSKHALGLSVG